jgi:hypothetical protein
VSIVFWVPFLTTQKWNDLDLYRKNQKKNPPFGGSPYNSAPSTKVLMLRNLITDYSAQDLVLGKPFFKPDLQKDPHCWRSS